MDFKRGLDPIRKMNVGHTRDTIKIVEVWFRQQSGDFLIPSIDLALDRLHKICNTKEVIPIHELNLYFYEEHKDGYEISLPELQGKRILYENQIFEIPQIWN